MHVNPPDPTRTVKDLDFNFNTGQFMGITLDETYGDWFEETDTLIKIHMGKRPSTSKVGEFTPEEDIEVFKRSLAFKTVRSRQLVVRTPEQEEEWKQTLMEMSKGIH